MAPVTVIYVPQFPIPIFWFHSEEHSDKHHFNRSGSENGKYQQSHWQREWL